MFSTLKSISWAGWSLIALLIIYALFFIVYNLQRHMAFQTTGFDLGNYDQAVWNTVHGDVMAITTVRNISSNWQIHFEPILLLLAPFYALYQKASTLLVLQTIIVTLGAIPIFLLARKRLQSDGAGLTFALVYLLFPAIQGSLMFDFHSLTLAPAFLSWALWFLANRQYRYLAGVVVLALICKENVSLIIFMLGGYIGVVHKEWRWAIGISSGAMLWFALANFVIIPMTSPVGENIHLIRYSHWGDSMGQVIVSLLTQPLAVLNFMFSGDRLFYWIRLTMPVVFLSFLDPLTLFIALPEMAINTLSNYPPNYQLDRFHYSVAIVPFVVVAGINGLKRVMGFIAPKLQHVKPDFLRMVLLLMVLVVTLIYQTQFGHTPIGRYFDWPVITERHQKTEQMLALIPPNAPVAAQNNLAPHLTQREFAFILPKISHQGQQAEYLAIDLQGDLVPYIYLETYCTQVQGWLNQPVYGLIFAEDGLLLFKKGVSDSTSFEITAPCENLD